MEQMFADEAIKLASKHADNGAPMQSSAVFSLEHARASYDRADFGSAKRWALRSLAYSVGVFHPSHKRLAASVEGKP